MIPSLKVMITTVLFEVYLGSLFTFFYFSIFLIFFCVLFKKIISSDAFYFLNIQKTCSEDEDPDIGWLAECVLVFLSI